MYGLRTRYIILANFCFELCFLLLDKNRNHTKVKEYRPIFVYTWFIMLQNYIHMRRYDLKELKRTNESDNQQNYQTGTGKLFSSILYFW